MSDLQTGQSEITSDAILSALTEQSVSRLEQHWADLKSQAYTTNREDGWCIHLRKEGTLFSQLGFRDGDVVPSRALLAQTKEVNQKALVERVLAIFEHLQETGGAGSIQ